MQSLIALTTTVDSRDIAESIANAAIQDRLTACVQIEGPITSFYTWQGKIEQATEVRMLFKTTTSQLVPLLDRIKKLHPYEVPQLTWVEIQADGSYGKWVVDSTDPS